jgi:predicted DNA binding CopG/RHH family protein
MRREYDFSKLKKAEPKYIKRLRTSITMRVDPQVIAYFKSLAAKTGLPYQSLINYVLKDYALHRLQPSGNWERLPRARKAS